jgi:uncharacterized protein YqiB (DUF1249 family)
MLMLPHNAAAATGLVPSGYADLMELYEANYMRLRLLVPEPPGVGSLVSRADGCLDLHLQVYRRCKYTSMLRLTYAFGVNGDRRLEPDLHIRVYHDARVAEACSRMLHHGRGRQDQTLDSTIQTKWSLNRFLYRWLGYCLHRGHVFEQAASRSVTRSVFDSRCETLETSGW